MTPNTPKIQQLKMKLENIEALRDFTEYELYSERLKEFLKHIHPIGLMSPCVIKHNKKRGWVSDIEFDCLGVGMFKIFKAKSDGSISDKWYGRRYYLHELDFNL